MQQHDKGTSTEPMNCKPEWNPDYEAIWTQRAEAALRLKENPEKIPSLKAFYAQDVEGCIAFIQDWCVTVDPRNVGEELPVTMPFILFPRQLEAVRFLYDHIMNKKRHCLVDKCRDSGITWIGAAISVWLWLYFPGVDIGWGSRKEQLVDSAGDVSSIFEKMRVTIRYLPTELLPKGYNKKTHLRGHMKLVNPENAATITGEVGDNIGRGGRKTVYFKDESAHYPRPVPIEAALGTNTNVQVDISTHLGTDTLFYNKTISWPEDRIFEFDWDQNPLHTDEWFAKQKIDYEAMGMPWLLDQEVLRNPAGTLQNVVIPQKWVLAAIDAHKYLHIEHEGMRRIGLDVADEGKDKNGLCERHGVIVCDVRSWPHGTTTETCQEAFRVCDEKRIYELVYDSIGVGAGVKGEAKRANQERMIKIDAIGWNAGGEVVDKKQEFLPGKTHGDMFLNPKAQAWWELRERFRKTWEAVERDEVYDPGELISIDSNIEALSTLRNQLSQSTYDFDGRGKIKIDKAPDHAKSPNQADAVVIAFARHDDYTIVKTPVKGLY